MTAILATGAAFAAALAGLVILAHELAADLRPRPPLPFAAQKGAHARLRRPG